LIVVAFLAVLAIVFGIVGTVAPPLSEAGVVSPQQESASSPASLGQFQNPPTYDSGWVDMRSKLGQYVTLKHGLNTTEVIVDITGKQSLDPMGGSSAWNRTYGGTNFDFVHSIVQTADGGYVLAGYTYSYGAGASDAWLVKTDGSGVKQWNKTYGGINPDSSYSLVQTDDGGYALAGSTSSYGAGSSDFWLVKTDGSGAIQWNKTYGGISGDNAYSMVQTADGGYALAGSTLSYGDGNQDFWLVKTDSTGNMMWNRTYGGTGFDFAYSMIETGEGGYALAGYTTPFFGANGDIWLVKTDGSGTMLWNRTYGGTGDDGANSVIQTDDGGYALAGSTTSYGAGSVDFWLIKTNSSGNALWNMTYGGAGTDAAYSMVQTWDEGYALAGATNSFGAGGPDFWLVKTDGSGNMLWNRTYGGTVADIAYSAVRTDDGGYALAGDTQSFGAGARDFWLVKVNAEMNAEHQWNLGVETGLAWKGLTNTTITIYRGQTDTYWNYVRIRIWLIKEPTWIYGDINMDGIVDAKDLYIIGRNYGKTFSLLSLSGITAIAGIYTIKKRKQPKQAN